MSLRSEIRDRAARADAGPRRRWGQNFLVDPVALDAIAEAATPVGTPGALEIGPGPGTLTERLAARTTDVVAIERDPRWASFLTDHFASDPGVRIVEGDATALDWRAQSAPGWVVVGNIPYNLSGPLLIRAWRARDHFAAAIFMVQAEVADRLTAPPGNKTYGSLSVLFQRTGSVDRVRRVPAGAFWPAPRVDSAVLRIEFDRALPDVDAERLEKVVRAAFGQRRKTLRNALAARFGRAWVEARAGRLDLGRRAETLSVQEFEALAEDAD